MDPLGIASGYATIVSLIGQFRAERKNEETVNYQDFVAWLIEHKHQEVMRAIEANHGTAVSVKALLNQRADIILAKIAELDALIAGISLKIGELAPLAESLYPGKLLSEDAIDIIDALNKSGSAEFFVVRSIGAPPYINFSHGGGLQFDDPRFLDDDLDTLLSLGFLTQRFSGSSTLYCITRSAVAYLKTIGKLL